MERSPERREDKAQISQNLEKLKAHVEVSSWSKATFHTVRLWSRHKHKTGRKERKREKEWGKADRGSSSLCRLNAVSVIAWGHWKLDFFNISNQCPGQIDSHHLKTKTEGEQDSVQPFSDNTAHITTAVSFYFRSSPCLSKYHSSVQPRFTPALYLLFTATTDTHMWGIWFNKQGLTEVVCKPEYTQVVRKRHSFQSSRT